MAADPAAHAVISSGEAPGVAEPAGRPAPEEAEGLLIEERSFALEQVADNGSKFHLANGYMGYRGTLEEFGRTEQVACTLAGLYDQAGETWREPVNAPNGLYTLIDCDGTRLSALLTPPAEHRQQLHPRHALHRRSSLFTVGETSVRLSCERFLDTDDVHLLAMAVHVQATRACRLTIETGIDAQVWDINGPHLTSLELSQDDGRLLAAARTNESDTLLVCERLLWRGLGAVDADSQSPALAATEILTAEDAEPEQTVQQAGGRILHRLTIEARPGASYCFWKFVTIFTSHDGVDDPRLAALAANDRAANMGYDRLRAQHSECWRRRWQECDVRVMGDPQAQDALRFSIFQLLQTAPTHSDRLSIPARGLSGQVYKGAIFWDTDLFMLPFYLYTQPRTARNLVRYRCQMLEGARRKAAEYGYQGAFYAWESQDTGDDACTLFGVTDVFSGRPVRTYFRDKQIHISADVSHALWQYYLVTGDESILFEGGAEVILECAHFYYSYAYVKPDSGRYELVDVTGPDEYHERVANNAFTNAMVRQTMDLALRVVEILRARDAGYAAALLQRLDIEDCLPRFQDMRDRLFVPGPEVETKVIEQFDGYHRLEDVSLATLKERVTLPAEYLGGGNGLATTTTILKQADVVTMLALFRRHYSPAVKEANWRYYEQRTEQGSTLSASMYALLAADIGRPEWAYPYFLTTATVDLTGSYKRFVGTLYIGGMHLGANGGAWLAAVQGFGGVDFDGQDVILKPALPPAWEQLSVPLTVRGQRFRLTITRQEVTVQAEGENTQALGFTVHGRRLICAPGQTARVAATHPVAQAGEAAPPY